MMMERGMREVLGQQRRREAASAQGGEREEDALVDDYAKGRQIHKRALHTKDSNFNSARRQRSNNTRGREKEEE
jgi:hypothetical protein